MENGRLWLGAMVFSDFSAEHFSIYHDQLALTLFVIVRLFMIARFLC